MSRLINTLSEIDDKFINEANPYKNDYENNGQVAETFAKEDDQKVIKIGRRLPKIAVAAIAFACVLVLGGGVVWAMTASPLKDYLFKNSDKEFEQVYTEVGKEFIFGNHKIVYEGSSYEDAVEHGYLNFSFWNLDGTPVNMEGFLSNSTMQDREAAMLSKDITLVRHIQSHYLNVGGDEIYLVMLYPGAVNGIFKDNNYYVKFARREPGEESAEFFKDKPFEFMLLDREQLEEVKNEISVLEAKVEAKELMTYTIEWDEETGLVSQMIPDYDYNYIQPEVMEILEKYDLCSVKSITSEPQIIQINNVKFVIGRMDMLLEYNTKDFSFDEFTLRREDGTEFSAHLEKHGTAFGVDYIWKVTADEDYKNLSGGSGDTKTGDWVSSFNYGFILGDNEKVKIEVDGQIYE